MMINHNYSREMEGKICLALSAIFGDRYVTNNGRVDIIDNGNDRAA